MEDRQAKKLREFLATDTRRERMRSGCQLYRDDLKSMSVEQIEAADKAGRFHNLRHGIDGDPRPARIPGITTAPVDGGHQFTRDQIDGMSGEEQAFYYTRGQLDQALAPTGGPTPARPPNPVAQPDVDGRQLERRDLAGMSPEAIEEARAAGQLDTMLGLR